MTDWKKILDDASSRVLKGGTSDGAKLGWETRRKGGAPSPEQKKKEEPKREERRSPEGSSKYKKEYEESEKTASAVGSFLTDRKIKFRTDASDKGVLFEFEKPLSSDVKRGLISELEQKNIPRWLFDIVDGEDGEKSYVHVDYPEDEDDDDDDDGDYEDDEKSLSLGDLLENVRKEGTSEGAKKGWETRRHGGAPAEESAGMREHRIKQEFNAFEALKKHEEVTHGGEKITVLHNIGYASRLPGSDTEYGHKGAGRFYMVMGYTSEGKDARDMFFDRKTGGVLVFDDNEKLLSGKKPESDEAAKPPAPAEKPKEPGKPKPLARVDVEDEAERAISALSGIKAENWNGRTRTGKAEIAHIQENKDGSFDIGFYVEGLKIGGPDDIDGNDGNAQRVLQGEGKKILQQRFPNHDVDTIGGEKGNLWFTISPKKEDPKTYPVVRGMKVHHVTVPPRED